MHSSELNRPLIRDYKFQIHPDHKNCGAFQDTVEGVCYYGQLIPKGTRCPDGIPALEDSLSFVDDAGDVATCWFTQVINLEEL